MRRRGLGTALVAAGAVAIGLTMLAWAAGALSGPERSSIDTRFALRGRHSPRDVAVVAIDPQTQVALGRFPFSRVRHADMIRRLLAAGAREVVYDVQFTEPTTRSEDNALVRAVETGERCRPLDDRGEQARRKQHLRRRKKCSGKSGAGGQRDGSVDPGGVLRRFPVSFDGLTGFAAATVEAAGEEVDRSEAGDRYPWIDYPGAARDDPRASFSDVLRGQARRRRRSADRIVVVGRDRPRPCRTFHADARALTGDDRPPRCQANARSGRVLRTASRSSRPAAGSTLALIVLLRMAGAARAQWLVRPLAAAFGAAVALGVVFAVGAQLAFNGGLIVTVALPAHSRWRSRADGRARRSPASDHRLRA